MATTNVPIPTLGPTGFIPPTQQQILAGVQADMNAAWGTTLNFGTPTNPTPQGQWASSLSAIIGNCYDVMVSLFNGVDPAYAYGRMQDAIARIYFLTRQPGESTSVECQCIGLPGTIIPANALAIDESQNIYFCVGGGIIPPEGTITLQFQNQQVGPIPCPAGTLNRIYKTVLGWDAINNAQEGVLGAFAETRAAFEARREASVEQNSTGFLDSILGQVLGIQGVLDAYVTDNANSYYVAENPDAVIVGSISGATLTITNIESGIVKIGQTVTGIPNAIGVAAGTVITGGSGMSWTVSPSQTVGSTTMNLGGVPLPPNSLYVAVVGGTDSDVAQAIWNKKSPGCAYYPGNTTVTVYDDAVQYPSPGVPYQVVFQRPPSLPFVIVVNIANGPDIPNTATSLIQAAVLAAFAGTDGGSRAKIGQILYANRFYAGINALGAWAEIVSLFLGSTNQPQATVTAAIGASFTGTISGNVLTVSAIGSGQCISVGDTVVGAGLPSGLTISSFGTGTGGNGTYNLSASATTSSEAMTTNSSVLNVTAVASGTVALNSFLFDSAGAVNDGTNITSNGTGSGGTGTYNLSGPQQRVASETMELVVANLTRVAVSINEAPALTTNDIQVNYI